MFQMLLKQLKPQEMRVKRRKEGFGELEEGARESVLSDDPPDSKYSFLSQNYRFSLLRYHPDVLHIVFFFLLSNVRGQNQLQMSRYQIEVPEELRHVLANDWDLVVHQKYLFKVPAKVNFFKGTILFKVIFR